MTTLAPICSACGAPTFGGACPRCRKQSRPLGGKLTYSPGSGPASGAVPIGGRLHALGGATSSGTTTTVPNITVPAGGTLVVYAGITGDTSQTTRSSVAWGAHSLVATETHFNYNSTLVAEWFFYKVLTTETADIVATNADPARDVAFAVANYVDSLGNWRQAWYAISSTPKPSASITIGIDPLDVEVHALWSSNSASDPGPWSGGAVGGQGLLVGGSYGPGYISTSIGPFGASPINPVKALTPATQWDWVTAEFFTT